jgi:DNA-binding transcriptional ArsR family regulator
LTNNELEGNTLIVYAYIVHAAKPVGTREVTRGAKISSTSVASRHLQKLEEMGLIEKNEYGSYILKIKTNINGNVWIGRSLVPRLMFYSFFFMGAFISEVTIMLLSALIKSFVIQVSFYLLTGMTAIAMALFLLEGVALYRKLKPEQVSRDEEISK